MNHPQLLGARWILALAAATSAAFLAFSPPAMHGAPCNREFGNGNRDHLFGTRTDAGETLNSYTSLLVTDWIDRSAR